MTSSRRCASSKFGFDLIVHHGSEGFKVAPLLAEAGVPVAINVLDTPGETLERRLDNPAALHAAGVSIALITDDPVQDSRCSCARRPRGSRRARVGRLASYPAADSSDWAPARAPRPWKGRGPGRLERPALSAWTHVLQTWVAGEVVYDRSDPADKLHATGGDAARARVLPEAP